MILTLTAAMMAMLVTLLVTPSVRQWVEQRGVVDQPEARRVNKVPKPRAGGIAIFAGFFVAVVVAVLVRQWRVGQELGHPQTVWTPQITGILLATTLMAILGLVDDFKNLSAKWQALALIGAGVILFAFGVRIEGITSPIGWLAGKSAQPNAHWLELSAPISALLTILWVFIVTKTVDAIDGVDGLAAGVCAISAATLALMASPTLALIAAAIAGACLGFLRHNYYPSKIIMGTIGAWVLGIVLASVSILGAFKAAAVVSVLVPVLVLGVPIFDFSHVLARRALERAPLTQADKRHLHHRLLERGWKTQQVVWFIYGVAAVFCVCALLLYRAGRPS